MKVQIVDFLGYDTDLGGFTVHVLIGGNEHEIINQCFPYEDGYADSLTDVYGSGADMWHNRIIEREHEIRK